MGKNAVAGPTRERFLKSYEIRRAFKDAVQCLPEVPGVRSAIDIHCHADQGHQDGLALAKHASQSSMDGILFKIHRRRAASREKDPEKCESLRRGGET